MTLDTSEPLDVAIIGGGPAGSTCGALLKKYRPDLRVGVFERERFPRDHVGESQLPPIGAILDEMGCWEAIEAAGFPIKTGATYRWGNSDKLWDFEFVPAEAIPALRRPRDFGELERRLAFQVERKTYDAILLETARGFGCEVHEATPVLRVECHDDAITGLVISGQTVTARYYVDASGGTGLLRRALGIGVNSPTRLQNIAIWDYWENASWPEGYSGQTTRVLVLSIGCGWLWFIPVSEHRVSIGFVCPKTFYKSQPRSKEDLYRWALEKEPLLSRLTRSATPEGNVQATRDWSFLAERTAGSNWLLAGESCGFADPILAAGLTLTHSGAREAAYTILALEDGKHDSDWLKAHYDQNQRSRIAQHIRFADLWYSANGNFADLQEYTRDIARDAGLELDAREAFQWLATGGFTHDILGQVGIGGFDLAGVKQFAQRLFDRRQEWLLSRCNRFRLQLSDARRETIPVYENGKVRAVDCYHKGSRRLPVHGIFRVLLKLLEHERDLGTILHSLQKMDEATNTTETGGLLTNHAIQALEFMLQDGWLRGSFDPNRPRLAVDTPTEGSLIHTSTTMDFMRN